MTPREELIALMRRFNKAQNVPNNQWTPAIDAEYIRIRDRIEALFEDVPGATWEWAKEAPW